MTSNRETGRDEGFFCGALIEIGENPHPFGESKN
jgi:hypothetical protein